MATVVSHTRKEGDNDLGLCVDRDLLTFAGEMQLRTIFAATRKISALSVRCCRGFRSLSLCGSLRHGIALRGFFRFKNRSINHVLDMSASLVYHTQSNQSDLFPFPSISSYPSFVRHRLLQKYARLATKKRTFVTFYCPPCGLNLTWHSAIRHKLG